MIRISRLLKSFRYAFRGLIKVLREEQNLRVQSFVALIAVFIGVFYHLVLWEWCIILIMIMIVFLMEIVNSAVERVTDVLKPRINTYVKEIKDIMAAAVMLASFFAVIVGLIIFIPHVFN